MDYFDVHYDLARNLLEKYLNFPIHLSCAFSYVLLQILWKTGSLLVLAA